MTTYLCQACATQYPPAGEPPGACPICQDPRQYVPHDTGQVWVRRATVRPGDRVTVAGRARVNAKQPNRQVGALVPLGDDAAVRSLWERYCDRLVRLARQKLRNTGRRVADEEDVDLPELPAAVGAGERAPFDGPGLVELPGLPVRALDGPGNDVLEAAERRPPVPRGLIEAEAVVVLDSDSAPGAVVGHRRNIVQFDGPDQDSRARGRRDGPGASRAGAPGARLGRARARSRAGPLRPLAREPAAHPQRSLRGGGSGDAGDRPRPEGGDDHARGSRRRR